MRKEQKGAFVLYSTLQTASSDTNSVDTLSQEPDNTSGLNQVPWGACYGKLKVLWVVNVLKCTGPRVHVS